MEELLEQLREHFRSMSQEELEKEWKDMRDLLQPKNRLLKMIFGENHLLHE